MEFKGNWILLDIFNSIYSLDRNRKNDAKMKLP